ncbi:MAG TPA: PEP/pyruvate-binding domain-containing protein [Solirubrobacteraceae bacterium]|nr:PEP/pyruvate-binding domain-containing protein [Solirubrobacteraceae bacterium]
MSIVLQFADPDCVEVGRAGGKGSSLARMAGLGLPVPPGFVVPANALADALPDHGVQLNALAQAQDAAAAQELIRSVELDPALRQAVLNAYAALGGGQADVPVAVRSSACAEDSEAASFAGQQETFLHVRGGDAVRARIRDCWASFFSERALFYRSQKGSLDDLGMAVVVQRMVHADVAGVLFTCDPVHNRRDRMVVEAVLGLGEAAVSGAVTPDHYVLKRDGRVRKAQVHEQPYAIVAGEAGGVIERPLSPDEGGARKAGDELLAELARIGADLEERVGVPQDIEWAVQDGELYVLQARPVTT